jgi:hypothetical protein
VEAVVSGPSTFHFIFGIEKSKGNEQEMMHDEVILNCVAMLDRNKSGKWQGLTPFSTSSGSA